MAANVTLYAVAFGDGRIEHLGHLLGTSKFDAIGRLSFLWKQCTDEQTYVLPESFVRVIVDPDLLIEARLGEREGDKIRIRGTRGKIEWYKKIKKNAKKGGAANRARWTAARLSDRLSTGSRSGEHAASPPILTHSHSYTHSQTQDPDHRSQPSVARAPAHDPTVPVPSADSPGLAELKAKVDRGVRLPRKQPMPEDWVPHEDHRAEARKQAIDVDAEAARFRDYCAANGTRYVDWKAAFRNWLRNAKRFGPRAQAGPDGLAHVLRIASGEIP